MTRGLCGEREACPSVRGLAKTPLLLTLYTFVTVDIGVLRDERR